MHFCQQMRDIHVHMPRLRLGKCSAVLSGTCMIQVQNMSDLHFLYFGVNMYFYFKNISLLCSIPTEDQTCMPVR